MKRVTLLILLLALVLSHFAIAAAPPGVKQALRGVVAIVEQEGTEWRFVCTGFATGVRLVTTAAHCVFSGKPAYVMTQTRGVYKAAVISRRYDAINDQALLALDTQDYLQPIYKCKNWPDIGDLLWVWGSPRGIMPILRHGIYSGPLKYWNNPVLEKALGAAFFSTINVDGGASGAPVLTAEGCYIGIVSMIFRADIKLDGAIFKKVF